MHELKLVQYLRSYIIERPKANPDGGGAPGSLYSALGAPNEPIGDAIGKAIAELVHPWGGYTISLDCETSTDIAQNQRVAFYQVNGSSAGQLKKLFHRNKRSKTKEELELLLREATDRLEEQGFILGEITPAEIEIVKAYAANIGAKVLSKDEFVKRFYYWAYKKRALVVGHNLAFDLSRFATDVVEARDFYNPGFSIRLCRCARPDDCANHPYIQIKHFGSLKQFIGFEGALLRPARQKVSRALFGYRDVGRALSGPGPASLYFMSRAFRSKWLKEEWPGPHGGRSRQNISTMS